MRTVVTDERGDGLDDQRDLDARTPGFATAVDVRHEAGARPGDAVPELIARTPGTSLRSLGGLGQFAAVSVRGSSALQVPLFVDGAPISSGFAGLDDLSLVPIDQLTRIEIYRGHVPVRFGSAAIGGAINLVTRPVEGRRFTIGGGLGSYGAREALAGVSTPLGAARGREVGFGARVSYGGATGNFPYYDTGGTPQLFDDDAVRRRANNGYDRLGAQVRLEGRLRRRRAVRWSLTQLGRLRRRQIAGTVGAPTERARLDEVEGRTVAQIRHVGLGRPGGSVAFVGSVGALGRRYTDPLGEVGIGVDDQRSVGADVFASPRLRLGLWHGAYLGLVADHRTEWIRIEERAGASTPGGPSGDADRRRHAWGVGVELEQFLARRRLRIVPSVRVDAIDSRFAVPADEGEQDDEGRDDLRLGVSPRAGLRLRIVDGLSLRATGGRYFRPPTLLELFGDRGFSVGNEGLVAERGTAIDLGLVLDRQLGEESPRPWTVYAQAAGFAVFSEELIQWVQAGPVVRPENVAGARVAGSELSVAVTAPRRWVIAQANYTFLHSENLGPEPTQRGAPLPGRPRHELFARISTGHRFDGVDLDVEPRLFYTFELVSQSYLDPSARFSLPPRVLHGAGAELIAGTRLRLAVEVRNFTNRFRTTWDPPVGDVGRVPVPVADYIGYPLPGISAWASLTIYLDLPRRDRRREVAS